MKRKTFYLLLGMLCCIPLLSFAETIQLGNLFYDINEENQQAGVVDHIPLDTIVDIPATIAYNGKTYSVTSIGYGAFWNSNLQSITIPESVTSIGKYAFDNQYGLFVTIPESVTSIGDYAFYGVPNIVYHGSATGAPWGARSVNGYVEGNLVYENEAKTQLLACSSFAAGELAIPESVTNIGIGAFFDCSNLTSITIPDGVTSIGNDAFRNCYSLTSVTIPNSVTSVGGWAFAGCSGITSITIPENVESMELYAFSDCRGLSSVTWNAKKCNESSSWSPFHGSNHITSFTFGDEVEHIPADLCEDLDSLTSITIPKSVTSIGRSVFSGCSSLTSVIWNAKECSDFSMLSSGYSYAPFYSIRSQITSFTFGDEVEHIPAYLCYGLDSLTSIVIPNSVTSIGERAFYDCVGLTSITIPDGVTSIGGVAFYHILNIMYNGSATGSPWGARSVNGYVEGGLIFESAAKTQLLACSTSATGEIIIPESVTSIGESAFSDCSGLTSVVIPESVTSIGNYAFSGCGITNICFPENVQSLGSYVLRNCSIDYIISRMRTPISIKDNMIGFNYPTQDIPLFVSPNSVPLYQAATYWKNYDVLSQGFIVHTATTTQTTASVVATHIAVDSIGHDRLGYVFANDTVWSSDSSSDSVSFTLTGLLPNTYYEYSLLADGILTEPYKIGKHEQSYSFTTKAVDCTLSFGYPTQTTIPISFGYDVGDAVNMGTNGIEYRKGNNFNSTTDTESIVINSTATQISVDTILRNLLPNTTYAFRPYVDIEPIGRIYGQVDTIRTNSISLGITQRNNTQKTLSLRFSYNSGDAKFGYITYNYKRSSESSYSNTSSYWYNDEATSGRMDTIITGLETGTTYDIKVILYAYTEDGTMYSQTVTKSFTTKDIVANPPEVADYGQTFVLFKSASEFGDAAEEIVSEKVEVSRTVYINKKPANSMGTGPSGPAYTIDTTLTMVDSIVKLNNLSPNTSYAFRSVVTTADGKTYESDGIYYVGTQLYYWQEVTTKAITLSTQTADGISNTSALLHGTIDCDQESYTEVGFEWKRSDAPETVQPQRLLVTDRVDENLLFRLEGLSGDHYYDYRTFCSYLGETYYGEWVGFLTASGAVAVPPTVQTVGAEVTEQNVEMKGLVVAGTEPLLQQGFEVWIKGTNNVKTTVAEGQVMTSYIPEPWSYTTYQYRAYAKTATGTTYGTTMEVTTGYIEREVPDVHVTTTSTTAEVTWTMVEVADYYLLTLFADAGMTDTIAVYEVSTDGTVNKRNMPGAAKASVSCHLDNLESETEYFFMVVAYNAADQKVAEESGSFYTSLMGLLAPNGNDYSTDVCKILRNGQVLILRDGKAYNLLGQEVR